MEEVTADDIRLALVPLSKKSEGLYNKVNMLLKCIFYAAERNQILEHNPCAGISGKGGKPTKKTLWRWKKTADAFGNTISVSG